MEICILLLILCLFCTQVTGESDGLSFALSDMEKFITFEPASVHQVFDGTPITHLEEDNMIPGNILAIQEQSVVTYYPNGTVQYIASSLREERFRNYEGSKDNVLILEILAKYGGLVQTIDKAGKAFLYVTLKYKNCIKAIDRGDPTLLHISGTCGDMFRHRYEERPAICDVSNATYYGPEGMAVYGQDYGTVTSFYVTEKFSGLITLVDLQSDIVTGFKPQDGVHPGPHAIALTTNNTLLVAAGNGLYECDSHGYFQQIIAFSRVQRSPDGGYGRAWGYGAHSIKRIADTDVYIFTEPYYPGVRIVDTKARQVRTLCYNPGKASLIPNDNRTLCNIMNPRSVHLTTNNTVVLVGMNNAVVKFQLTSQSYDGSLKVPAKDTNAIEGIRKRMKSSTGCDSLTEDCEQGVSLQSVENGANVCRTCGRGCVVPTVLLGIAICCTLS